MGDWGLRLRAVLDGRESLVAAVVIALVLTGGWLTYTAYVEPGTTTEQRTVATWETTAAFDHGATVVSNTSVFAAGTRLSNRSVYFTSVAPRLDGTFQYTYDASASGRLDQDVSLSLVAREVWTQGDQTTTLWETTRPLGNVSVTAVPPGESVSIPFSFNASVVANRTDRIRDELGGSAGEMDVSVRASVTSEGTVNGTAVSQTETYTLPVTLNANTYELGDGGPTSQQYDRTRAVTVERPVGPLHSLGGPLLVLAGLSALAWLPVARRRGWFELSEAERERLAFERERAEFDEWISTIELPDSAFELPRAEAQSLGALVDFAIDTDNAVIETPQGGAYHVCYDDVLYTYRPPTAHPPRDGASPERGDQPVEELLDWVDPSDSDTTDPATDD